MLPILKKNNPEIKIFQNDWENLVKIDEKSQLYHKQEGVFLWDN